jgi:hypothetical protein
MRSMARCVMGCGEAARGKKIWHRPRIANLRDSYPIRADESAISNVKKPQLRHNRPRIDAASLSLPSRILPKGYIAVIPSCPWGFL